MTAPARDDKPTDRRAASLRDFMTIVTHPAFRIGFLDALTGKRADHEAIMDRIARETPPGKWMTRWDRGDTALAQYRYEEGRQIVLDEGVIASPGCWTDPLCPPPPVLAWIRGRLARIGFEARA